MKLPIVTFPDPVLRKKALEIKEINPELDKLIERMIETMYEDDGVGLAAPQVGESIRLICVDETGPKERKALKVLINPEIIESEGELDFEESCLSVPAFKQKITRKARVVVKALDRKGKEVRIEGDDLLAVIFQHEIDHLDGRLIVDYAGRLKRSMYEKRARKWKSMMEE